MKKLLGIVVLCLLWCNVGIAAEREPGTDKKCRKLIEKEKFFKEKVLTKVTEGEGRVVVFYFSCKKNYDDWGYSINTGSDLLNTHDASYRRCMVNAKKYTQQDCFLYSIDDVVVWGKDAAFVEKVENEIYEKMDPSFVLAEAAKAEDEFLSTWSDEVNPIPKYTLNRLFTQKNLLERMKKLRLKGDDWKYECTKEDFVKYVAIEEGCIGILKLGKIDKSKKKLVIFLHGDRKNNSDYNIKKEYPFSSIIKDQKENINFFYLARPGHKFNGRTRSTGKETSGEQKGNWNAIYKKSWDQIKLSARAIKKLKEHYQPDELILIGSSGGAHLTAITLGRIPGLVDKAILVGCSCTSGWPNDLSPWESPLNQIKNIDPNAKIILITGDKDEVTPAWQAEAYAKKAKKRGLNAQIHIVKGGHSILGKKEVKKIIKEAL